jgi:hypothetical protein
MPINQAALSKVRDAKTSGKGFASVLEGLAATLILTGAAETSMSFDYQHEDIEVVPGDLIPFITVGLRQATLKLPLVNFDATGKPEEPTK